MQTNPDPVAVTVEDREAFASVYDANAPKYAEQIRAGDMDESPLLCAFACHRQQSIAEAQAASVVEGLKREVERLAHDLHVTGTQYHKVCAQLSAQQAAIVDAVKISDSVAGYANAKEAIRGCLGPWLGEAE